MSAEFFEKELPEGYVAVTWQADTSREWKRVLQLIKTQIPPDGRKYVPQSKTWSIAPGHLTRWEEIKSIMGQQDSEELFDEIDKRIDEDILLDMVSRGLSALPPSMRNRALFAIEAANDLVEAPLEYSYSEGLFGAWNEQAGAWFYEDGRYSKTSPHDRDSMAISLAWERLQTASQRLPGILEKINQAPDSWKIQFRRSILKKYSHQCYTCLQRPTNLSKLHMHRVVPGRLGGQYIDDNVVLVCSNCHKKCEGKSWKAIRAINKEARDNEQ